MTLCTYRLPFIPPMPRYLNTWTVMSVRAACSVQTQQFPFICLLPVCYCKYVMYNVHIQMVWLLVLFWLSVFLPYLHRTFWLAIFIFVHFQSEIIIHKYKFFSCVDAHSIQRSEITRRTPFATWKCIDASSVALHENMNRWTEICIHIIL